MADKMRNLLSINAYHYRRGGADNVYLDHAALMGTRGWAPSYYSMHHPENLPCDDDVYFADEIDYAKPARIVEKISHGMKIIYSPEARSKISALLDAKPIDVAHVHSIYHHQSPSILYELKKRGIPTVLTAHDLKLACPAYTMLNRKGVCERCKGGKLWNVVTNRCIKGSAVASALIMLESAIHQTFGMYANNVDYVIAPSKFYKDKLSEWGFPLEKLVHIPNFVPKSDVLSPKVGGEYFLYFGRLSAEKGLATLIRAAAISRSPVRIVGRGPQEGELRELSAALNAPVHFDGFQSGQALWELVDGARAVVLPSEWYENGPLSVIEAFQRGKPLIGARIGGIPELVLDDRTGWSFTSGDSNELAEVMVRVAAKTEAELRIMAQQCQLFAREHHSEEAYVQAVERIYLKLMG